LNNLQISIHLNLLIFYKKMVCTWMYYIYIFFVQGFVNIQKRVCLKIWIIGCKIYFIWYLIYGIPGDFVIYSNMWINTWITFITILAHILFRQIEENSTKYKCILKHNTGQNMCMYYYMYNHEIRSDTRFNLKLTITSK